MINRGSEVDNVSNEIKKEHRKKSDRLQRVSVLEKRTLDDAVSEATRVKGKKLTVEERRKVLCIAREQIRSQREADEIKRERDQERHSVEFVWKRPERHRR